MSFRFCMYTTKKAEGQAWISVVWFTQSQSLVSVTKIIVHVSQKPWAEHHGLLDCRAPAVAEGGASGHKVEFRTVPLLHGHELMWVKTIKYIWTEESRVLTRLLLLFYQPSQHNIIQHNPSCSLINALLLAQTVVLESSAPENTNHTFSIRVCGLICMDLSLRE